MTLTLESDEDLGIIYTDACNKIGIVVDATVSEQLAWVGTAYYAALDMIRSMGTPLPP